MTYIANILPVDRTYFRTNPIPLRRKRVCKVAATTSDNVERRRANHTKSGFIRHLAFAILLGFATFCEPTYATGGYCTRFLPLDIGPVVCAPVETFTSQKWALVDGGDWSVLGYSFPSPWPVFDSDTALITAFVAANPDANVCGTSPYLYQDFTYHWAFDHQLDADYLGDMRYTDAIAPAIGGTPDLPFGRTIEEGSKWYKWIVPSQVVPTLLCNATRDIIAWRRRIAACPVGYNPDTWGYPYDLDFGTGFHSAELLQDPQVCVKRLPYELKTLGACTGPNQIAGNPISIATGNKYEVATDIVAEPLGALGFERHYNSVQLGSWELGAQWRHSYDRSVRGWSAQVFVSRPDGKVFQFSKLGSQWTPDRDVSDRLYQLLDANGNPVGWRYVTTVDDTEIYDASGKLQSMGSRSGVTQTLTYSVGPTPTAPKANLLIRVTDNFGRQLSFAYDSLSRISQITDTLGKIYQYSYTASGNLATIAYPDGGQRSYLYNEPQYTQSANLPWVLTGILDENGNRYATFSYDSTGRAISSEHAGGVDKYQFNYVGVFAGTVVTDPLGTQRTYVYTYSTNPKNTSLSLPCPSCGNGSISAIAYDSNTNPSAITDFNRVQTTYIFDLARNLETSRTEAAGSGQSRTIQTQWDATWRLPAKITEPAAGGTKTTTFTYDAYGNLTQKSILAPKNDGSGTTISRTWKWTYGTLGRVLTAADPDSHTTTYTYYADTDPDLGKRGNVQSIANAVGHTTQITAYDASGRPLSIADPNGLTTIMTYDPRGRLALRRVGGEQTAYSYDGVGQLTRVTLPDGSYVQYIYDAAHRLIQIKDGLGNKIVYTLDAMGNRVGENAYDTGGQLARTRSRQFDALNRLATDLGAQGQATTYTYDNSNNLLTTMDPLGHSAGNSYDALNRLTQVLDPNHGVTKYGYDAANNLIQVTDPRSVATAYKYDGFSNLVQQISPDTGTTINTYDAAGNILTKTDARGVTATYTYDSINRANEIVYSNGVTNEIPQFQYDVGANAKGRLSQVTDTSGSTGWTYNGQGRVAGKVQNIDSITKTLTYGYNTAGQLTSITTPSGQQVGYSYLNNRIVNVTVNGQTLLQGAVTTPFGPISSWRWGNGLFAFRDYDKDGRLATWEFRNGVSILRKDQTFDAASRITAISDPNVPAANQAYQYDVLGRLTVAQTGAPPTHTQQFSYDAVGNRLNVTLDAAVTNSTYAATSNRLQVLSGVLPASYLLGSGSWSLLYNNANRLSIVKNSSTTIATYRINALGQRVSKNVGGAITYYVYDEQGHLLGEYDGVGNLVQETVWLEDLPVATLRPIGTGNPPPIAIYYVHADHLGSPRAITRPDDNAIMWQWDNLDAFGTNLANENPAGQWAFEYALRFPGQYYDTETGMHYNYYRDYDPTIGRYEQSDPIGLDGGLNTYGYAGADPEDRIDPNGLAWLCTAPLHVAPRLDFGGHGPAHHEFVCDTPQHCGGQDWSREPWYGNPIFGPGIPSVGDRFNPGRCTKIQPDNQCMNDCLAGKIDDPGRPPYSVIPRFSWSIAPNCQEWAEAIIQVCRPGCIGKK